jgi:hypothetical protein
MARFTSAMSWSTMAFGACHKCSRWIICCTLVQASQRPASYFSLGDLIGNEYTVVFESLSPVAPVKQHIIAAVIGQYGSTLPDRICQLRRIAFARRVKKPKRISFPTFMEPLPPAPCLAFPLATPHTPSQGKPQERRWETHGLEAIAGLFHRLGRPGALGSHGRASGHQLLHHRGMDPGWAGGV